MNKTDQIKSGVLRDMRRMLHDEGGAATAWNIFWLTNFAVLGGLTIDSTNARRVETLMVSTADVASLAGVMELPSPHLELPYNSGGYVGNVEAKAKKFAVDNLNEQVHGTYFIESDDVYVGHWDTDTRSFTWGGGANKPVNAVQVYMGRNENHGNRLSTSLLRIIGFEAWDINTTATALMSIPNCYRNGVVAAGELKVNSNAAVYSGVCLHGESGVEVQNNNTWWPNTAVSGGWSAPVSIAPNQYDENNQDHEVNQIRGHTMPSDMTFDIINVGRGLLDLNNDFAGQYNPDYALMRVAEMQDPTLPVIEMNDYSIGDTIAPPDGENTWLDDGVEVASLDGAASLMGVSAAGGGGTCTNSGNSGNPHLGDMRYLFDKTFCPGSNLTEYRTYYAPCSNKMTISGTVRNVVIVSECKVQIQNGSVLENVMLVVLNDSKHKSIDRKAASAGQGVRFGAVDQCTPGGGVRIWVRGDFHTASGTQWYGAQVYVAHDFHLAGQTEASGGISAHVGNDAHISAQAEIAGLFDNTAYIDESAGGPGCQGEVDFDWITSDYHYVLVD